MSKQYLIADILVEATKSEGGGFYELTVLATGMKQRYLSDVFEQVAVPLGICDYARTPHIKKDHCINWRQE